MSISLPSPWKIQRELKRVARQVVGLVPKDLPDAGKFRRLRYDCDRHWKVKVTEGEQAARDLMAIQLIYQPSGILASFFEELQFFAERGFSCIVVSNVAIPEADKSRLRPLSHLIIERPNVGYDFGGYREGVLTLRDRALTPKHLVIKNDSIWFPLRDNCTVLDRAISSKSDLFGIFLNSFRDVPHLQSYFLHFGPQVMAHQAFWDYWENLGLWNNKTQVIDNCEKRLTREFKKKGFSYEAQFEPEDMARAIAAADDALLQKLLDFHLRIKYVDGGKPKEINAPQGTPAWRTEVIAKLIHGVSGHMLMICHPDLAIHNLEVPVLKKDKRMIYRMQREEILRSGADLLFRETVRKEVRNWDAGANLPET